MESFIASCMLCDMHDVMQHCTFQSCAASSAAFFWQCCMPCCMHDRMSMFILSCMQYGRQHAARLAVLQAALLAVRHAAWHGRLVWTCYKTPLVLLPVAVGRLLPFVDYRNRRPNIARYRYSLVVQLPAGNTCHLESSTSLPIIVGDRQFAHSNNDLPVIHHAEDVRSSDLIYLFTDLQRLIAWVWVSYPGFAPQTSCKAMSGWTYIQLQLACPLS